MKDRACSSKFCGWVIVLSATVLRNCFASGGVKDFLKTWLIVSRLTGNVYTLPLLMALTLWTYGLNSTKLFTKSQVSFLSVLKIWGPYSCTITPVSAFL